MEADADAPNGGDGIGRADGTGIEADQVIDVQFHLFQLVQTVREALGTVCVESVTESLSLVLDGWDDQTKETQAGARSISPVSPSMALDAASSATAHAARAAMEQQRVNVATALSFVLANVSWSVSENFQEVIPLAGRSLDFLCAVIRELLLPAAAAADRPGDADGPSRYGVSAELPTFRHLVAAAMRSLLMDSHFISQTMVLDRQVVPLLVSLFELSDFPETEEVVLLTLAFLLESYPSALFALNTQAAAAQAGRLLDRLALSLICDLPQLAAADCGKGLLCLRPALKILTALAENNAHFVGDFVVHQVALAIDTVEGVCGVAATEDGNGAGSPAIAQCKRLLALLSHAETIELLQREMEDLRHECEHLRETLASKMSSSSSHVVPLPPPPPPLVNAAVSGTNARERLSVVRFADDPQTPAVAHASTSTSPSLRPDSSRRLLRKLELENASLVVQLDDCRRDVRQLIENSELWQRRYESLVAKTRNMAWQSPATSTSDPASRYSRLRQGMESVAQALGASLAHPSQPNLQHAVLSAKAFLEALLQRDT